MTEFKPGDEVRVQEPQSQDGRWVFPGERLFVQEVTAISRRAYVRCPAAHTSVWVDFENLMPPSSLVDMRTLFERVEHLERRVAELEDAAESLAEMAAEGVVVASWRDDPYSLPPATTEGVKCPACSVQNRPHPLAGRLISHETVLHADQATADECVRRQDAMTYRHL